LPSKRIFGRAVGALVVVLTFTPGLCTAETLPFRISAGFAEQTLQVYAGQAHLQILYDVPTVTHHPTASVVGNFEAREALRLLLQGSGLGFEFLNSRSINIKALPLPKSSESPAPHQKERSFTGAERSRPPVAIPDQVKITASKERDGPPIPPGVFARTIPGSALTDWGITTLEGFAQTLTQNQGSGATEDTHDFPREAVTNTAFGGGMNLYGLGSRATLILVNGRRLAPSGSAGGFTDISNVPVTAVDHILLMSDANAAAYGADAIGGIVNIVLRGDTAAPDSDAVIGHVTRGTLGEKQFAQSFGHKWSGLGFFVAAEYYERDALPASDRLQATSNLTAQGGTNLGNIAGNPATIMDATGRLWGVPADQGGLGLSLKQLTAGPNYHDRYSDTWILPHQQRLSLLATADAHLTDNTTLSLDTLANQRRVISQDAGFTATLTIPHDNPYYVSPIEGSLAPIEVLYGFSQDLGPVIYHGTVNTGQFVLTLTHEFTGDWTSETYAGYAYEAQNNNLQNLVDFGKLAGFLTSDDASSAFDALGDGSYTSKNTLKAIRASEFVRYKSSFTFANMTVSGSPLSLPAGAVGVTAGADWRAQNFRSSLGPANVLAVPPVDRDRTVGALFMQLAVPVLPRLNLSGGLRYEHYSDAGEALSPQFGFAFAAKPNLTFRGTWARLFRPPNLPDLNEATDVSQRIPLLDPTSPSRISYALVWAGQNAELRPETGKSWALGTTWAPLSHPNLSTTLTYFNIDSGDRVFQVPGLPATVLSDPQYAWLVQRDVTPADRAQVCSRSQFIGVVSDCYTAPISAIVDMRLHNGEELKTDGIDASTQYAWKSGPSRFSADLDATYMLHYRDAPAPGAALIEERNSPHNPTALRVRGMMRWESRGLSISPAINVQSAYEDPGFPPLTPARHVRSWITWDGVIAYELPSALKVSLRGLNVFNQQPPFLNNVVSSIGYDQENGDLLGRRVSVSFEKRW
jgi:iron complex outermembrane receptor protein